MMQNLGAIHQSSMLMCIRQLKYVFISFLSLSDRDYVENLTRAVSWSYGSVVTHIRLSDELNVHRYYMMELKN